MSIYTLDYNVYINEFLPPDKRGTVQKAWLGALAAPIITLHSDIFTTYYPDVIGRAKQNGQKIIMEDALNSTFGVAGPSFIYIDNTGDDVGPKIFFNEGEGYPGVTLYNESEGETPFYFVNEPETVKNNDFIVYVPAAVLASVGAPKIAAEVDRLRPYSTTYQIISY